ncbi:MAG TPA: hypothetical protein PL131_10965 [Methylotenera sp.]|nr:hypothetical protein [Methylotenera sp.]HPH06386.1 hypothetical protein [Methylotenera sp.]HPN01838.1 hypothetical protein [Methylotenera sp.]
MRDLFKTLVSLSNFNAAKIADLAGVKRPNLYTWQGGKTQALSDGNIESLFNILGIIKGKLSPEIVYRWQVDFEVDNLKSVLKHFVSQDFLNQAVIYFIEIDGYNETESKKHNLIQIPQPTGNLTILISAENRQAVGFPVKSAKLGFGKDSEKVNISSEQWLNWWDATLLSSTQFWTEFSLYLKTFNSESNTYNDQQDIDQLNAYQSIITEKTAENAGLKAIVRSLLRELRIVNPKNTLLNHENRDLIYREFYEHELSKMRKDD